ncbi:MAG: YndM family protein [Firmicutes bacterium]|nr:YndM family protein [Bacillota bacterium]
MKNLTNLVIKTAMVLLMLILLTPIFGRSTWTQTVILGLVLVVFSYVLGDLWILPRFGAGIALVADFTINLIVLWLMERALPQFLISGAGVWLIALAITIGEWFFHRYLLHTQAPGKKKTYA